MNNGIIGFAVFGVVIYVLSRVLDVFDFSFVESGQKPRGMGGQVPDNGYGVKARTQDNNPKVLYDATKEFFANRKRDLGSFSAKVNHKE
jgi:hypothetical protein